MVKGLYAAYTGMVNEERRMDVLANNLANATTTGYKKEGAVAQSFEDQLSIRIKDTSTPGYVHYMGGDYNLGAKIGETYTDYSQGSFQVTDKPSDLAIAGDGFFAISFTNKAGVTSIKYTRDGAFSIDSDGYFRTSDGDYLLNRNAALNSNPNGYVKIDPTADYKVDTLGNVYQNNVVVANIGVVTFENKDYLAKYGENLYDLVDGGRVVASDATIEQGALEASNVNVVDEMVNLIAIQRAYESGQKMIQTVDSTLDKAVNTVGKIGS